MAERRIAYRATTGLLASVAALSANPAEARVPGTDMSGSWVVVQRLVSDVKVPVVGLLRSETWVVGVVELTQDGDRVRGEGPVCAIRTENEGPVSTEFPPAFRRGISPIRVDARVERSGGRLALVQKEQWRVQGANVRDARTSPLPTTPGDARVSDPDRDGAPGLTVHIRGLIDGAVHVVQRGSMAWYALERPDGKLEGPIRFDHEQVILSATSKWLASAPESQPNLAESRIWLERATPGASGCDVVSATARR